MSCHLAFLSVDDTFFQLQKDFVKMQEPVNSFATKSSRVTRGGAASSDRGAEKAKAEPAGPRGWNLEPVKQAKDAAVLDRDRDGKAVCGQAEGKSAHRIMKGAEGGEERQVCWSQGCPLHCFTICQQHQQRC